MNTVTPVVTLITACVLVRWLASGNPVYAGLLGVALYLLVFFEPLPLAMGLLFAALLIRAVWLKSMSGPTGARDKLGSDWQRLR